MRRLFTAAAVVAFSVPSAMFAQADNALALAPAPVAPAVTMSAPIGSAPTTAPTTAPTAMARPDVAGIQRYDAAAARADAHTMSAAAATGLHQGQGMALMVVGGAAIVGGLLIGDDGGHAVAIGGLIVGLVGLYEYVR